jgi:repressor of nif and glnA expression
MKLTYKQRELLRVIAEGDGAIGTAIDLDQILERIRYETTKQSLQFSIRALVNHGLIAKLGLVKRRGRVRQEIQITPAGLPYAAGRDLSAGAGVVDTGVELDPVPGL